MDINGGSLYEINQRLMEREKVLSPKEIKAELENLKDFFTEKYYLLLCHEKRDYTFFNLCNININILLNTNILADLYECLTNRGKVQSIEKLDNGAIEIWIKDEEGTSSAYYLFPCSNCVIETKYPM